MNVTRLRGPNAREPRSVGLRNGERESTVPWGRSNQVTSTKKPGHGPKVPGYKGRL